MDVNRINVVSLGCSKNLVDSETLLGQLKVGKAAIVDSAHDADTVVINTCGFIEAAKRESVDAILEAVDLKKQGRLKNVVVMGCLSERFKSELSVEIPDVDAFFGSDNLPDVLSTLGVDFKRELLGERLVTTPPHFSYLKISEGCSNPCSFCSIPLMRGFHRSKPMRQVADEARTLVSHGVKELIVIAQDTTSYGLDLYGVRRLRRLLDELNGIEGLEWIRLMYAYPAKFPMEVLDALRDLPKLCRYIDIPVQHASDHVLKSMRRGITNRAMRELLHKIKTAVPDVAIRTTLIVGYPNESEDDFNVLCDFVREMRFHRLGVFTYSQEEGTTAYDLGDPIPVQVKEERQATIMEIQRKISEERNQALVGSTTRVLVDRTEDAFKVGRTQWDAPEIDQEVLIRSAESLSTGQFADVRITDATEYDLYAMPI